MTLPLSSPFTSHTKVTKVQLDQLVTAINALPRGSLGKATDPTGTRTLAATATNYASTCSQTFTLTDSRRIQIAVQARFVPNTVATGRYSIQAAYNSGGSVVLGSAVVLDVFEADYENPGSSGLTGSDSQNVLGDDLLAAGTWTAYAVVQRLNGGDNGDTATGFAVRVQDIGAV